MNENQNKKMSAFSFKVMSFLFKIRDFFSNPMKKVEKAQIREGDIVVDYGCGPGSYSIAASKKVGAEGKVYALDVLPVAIKMVQKKVTKIVY
ncbi:MAG: SAM-dependent methyltransferase [Candidatus Lokiarchaeota archaeon]